MAFEPINNVNPKSTTTVRVPDDGVLLRPRKITRKGSNEVVRWIELSVGAAVAKALAFNLNLDIMRVAVLFGTGTDSGKLQLQITDKGGFETRRRENGTWFISLNEASVGKLLPMQFDALVCTGVASSAMHKTGQPPIVTFPIDLLPPCQHQE